jgi:alkylation response protein AidB-like acyl-CoA dehydrogenase
MYHAPLEELRFVLDELLDVQQLAALPRFAEFSSEYAASVLEQAGHFAQGVLAPLNRSGDRSGAVFRDGAVRMPDGFRSAYRRFVDDGWPLLTVDEEQGGQGAPLVLASAVEEIWCGANLSFMLCPLLGRGALEALSTVATPALQALLGPRLRSGEWTGTMNLTEPQAGSDLAAIRTRAVPDAGHSVPEAGRSVPEAARYRITGQKIFITYGEHDLADNIVHLVLARLDGAPAGVKGITMFVVPKRLINADGTLGEPNDVRCASIEHKLGIHASPTCLMSFGDAGGALGYLVGEPHQGLDYMFIMMNAARLSVGVQGVGLSELALQQARQWAHTRVQGRPIGGQAAAAIGRQAIVHHPDVRRMLLTLRAQVEAMRALALYAALQLDRARAEAAPALRAAALLRGELLIPIVKGWCTEQAIDLASLSLQVHGGMGYIEETGVAQTLRDVRITSIYEGTTGIQANDLLGRKLLRDRGAAMAALLRDLMRELNDLRATDAAMRSIRNASIEAVTVLRDATEALLYQLAEAPVRAHAVGVPYLRLSGIVLGAALMARGAGLAARRLEQESPQAPFYRAKLQTARFYAEHLLPRSTSLLRIVKSGGASVAEADPDLI